MKRILLTIAVCVAMIAIGYVVVRKGYAIHTSRDLPQDRSQALAVLGNKA